MRIAITVAVWAVLLVILNGRAEAGQTCISKAVNDALDLGLGSRRRDRSVFAAPLAPAILSAAAASLAATLGTARTRLAGARRRSKPSALR